MKCLIDTNILVSASLYPDSAPAQAFFKAVTSPYRGVVSDYSLEELRRVYNRKFPHKISALERFISLLLLSVEVISTPSTVEPFEEERLIRDENDRPILRAALYHHVDVILTGDKDFLEAGLRQPRVMNAASFMQA